MKCIRRPLATPMIEELSPWGWFGLVGSRRGYGHWVMAQDGCLLACLLACLFACIGGLAIGWDVGWGCAVWRGIGS